MLPRGMGGVRKKNSIRKAARRAGLRAGLRCNQASRAANGLLLVSRPVLVATGMAVHRAHARLAGQPAMDRRAGLRASQVALAGRLVARWCVRRCVTGAPDDLDLAQRQKGSPMASSLPMRTIVNNTSLPGFFAATAMPDPDWWQALWSEPEKVFAALGVLRCAQCMNIPRPIRGLLKPIC